MTALLYMAVPWVGKCIHKWTNAAQQQAQGSNNTSKDSQHNAVIIDYVRDSVITPTQSIQDSRTYIYHLKYNQKLAD